MSIQFIFDLDHTVIDSSHRQSTLADGSLDLAHWIEHNTPELIAQDKLLPLADQMRKAHAKGAKIIICTARVMQDADFEFLANNNLPFHVCLSRGMGDSSADTVLKEKLLKSYALKSGSSWARFRKSAVMFDDNLNVIKHLTDLGLSVYNSIELNKRLA